MGYGDRCAARAGDDLDLSSVLRGERIDQRGAEAFPGAAGLLCRHADAIVGDRQLPIASLCFVPDDDPGVLQTLREGVLEGIEQQFRHDQAEADRLRR